MKFSEYKDLIKERLEAYFSFLPDNTHLAQNYDLAAEFSSRQIQTALFKENVMDYLDSKEFCLLSNLQDEQTIDSELAKLPDIAISSANPSRHHKSTVVTRVFVTEKDVSPATLSKIKKSLNKKSQTNKPNLCRVQISQISRRNQRCGAVFPSLA